MSSANLTKGHGSLEGKIYLNNHSKFAKLEFEIWFFLAKSWYPHTFAKVDAEEDAVAVVSFCAVLAVAGAGDGGGVDVDAAVGVGEEVVAVVEGEQHRVGKKLFF